MSSVKVFLSHLSAFSQQFVLAEKRAVIKDLMTFSLDKGVSFLVIAEIILISDHVGYSLDGSDVVNMVELHHKAEDIAGRSVFRRTGEAFEDLFVRGNVQ